MVHITAPYVQNKNRVIQRCAICGLLLIDNNPGDTPNQDLPPLEVFAPGVWVFVDPDGIARLAPQPVDPDGVTCWPTDGGGG